MEISRQEAIDLLHKWYAENTVVSAVLFSADETIKIRIMGFVTGLHDKIAVSSTGTETDPPCFMLVPGQFMASYDYSEGHGLGGVQISTRVV